MVENNEIEISDLSYKSGLLHRVTESGKQTIPDDEGAAQFGWQTAKQAFTVDFDVSRMVDGEGRDL